MVVKNENQTLWCVCVCVHKNVTKQEIQDGSFALQRTALSR